MKKTTLLICSLFVLQGLFSQGIYESYVILNVNSGSDYYYNNAGSSGNTDFHNHDLGDFSSSNSLTLKGGQIKVWKDGNCWNLGNPDPSKLLYSINPSDFSGTMSFSSINLDQTQDLGWPNEVNTSDNESINLLNGLTPGEYKITVYYTATFSCNSGGPVTVYDSNSNNNYSATFRVLNYSSDQSISSDKTFADVVVDSGVTLTISDAGSLNVTNTLTNNGTIVMQSSSTNSAALKANLKAGSGTYSYQKYTAAYNTTNDLISPPFSGESFSNLLSNNSGVIYTNPSDNTQYLFGPFSNNDGAYLTYDSDTDGNLVMTAGIGYRVGTASAGTITFTGTFLTSDQTVATSVGSDGTYGKWNLVGNPFPTYLDLGHFFDDNVNKLASGFGAIYAYDGDESDNSNWTEYNALNYSGVKIAPGQAFFVASNGSQNLAFDLDMQTITGDDDFISGFNSENDSHIKLTMFDGNKFAKTDVYFNQNATNALDHGYDAGTFANTTSDFAIYTTLADQSDNSLKLAIQAIPQNFTEVTSIPLGIISDVSNNMNISIENAASLQSIYVYLKDYETGELTLLNDEPYSFSIDTPINGIDRFELRISNFTMSNEALEFNNLIFKVVEGNEKITFVGDFLIGDIIEVYDFLGKKVLEKNIDSESSFSVSKNSIESGFYIANLIRNGQSKTIKFVNN